MTTQFHKFKSLNSNSFIYGNIYTMGRKGGNRIQKWRTMGPPKERKYKKNSILL